MFGSRKTVVGLSSRSREQALALLMARHPRLGRSSPARRLSYSTVGLIMTFLSDGSRTEHGFFGLTVVSDRVFARTRDATTAERAQTCTGLGLGFFDWSFSPAHSYLLQFTFLGTSSFGFGFSPTVDACVSSQRLTGWMASCPNSFCYACNGLTARDGLWKYESKYTPLSSGTVISVYLVPSRRQTAFDVYVRQDCVTSPAHVPTRRSPDLITEDTSHHVHLLRQFGALRASSSYLDRLSMTRVAKELPGPVMFGVCILEQGGSFGLHRCMEL